MVTPKTKGASMTLPMSATASVSQPYSAVMGPTQVLQVYMSPAMRPMRQENITVSMRPLPALVFAISFSLPYQS